MPIVKGKCPNCGASIELYSTHAFGVCSYCGKQYRTEEVLSGPGNPEKPFHLTPETEILQSKPQTVQPQKKNAVYKESEVIPDPAQDCFLSGSSYLALGNYAMACEQFLKAAKLAPGNPKYWLYLLCAATDRFTRLYRLCGESDTVKAGDRRIYCRKVYKNFLNTADSDDYIFVKGEFGIDLSPDSCEIWENVLTYILRKKNLPFSLGRASATAEYAYDKLSEISAEKAELYRNALCRRLNPQKDGVLEINTLRFYPETENGVFSAYENTDTIEFASDNMSGSKNFRAFLLKKGVETIGVHFPFEHLITDRDVEKIPDKLICFCGKLRKVTLGPEVSLVGRSAFEGCVNLSAIENTDKLKEISDRAFFGTAVRVLDISPETKKLGREILGCGARASEHCEIEKYLIKLDASLAAKSKGFNNVGAHKCGYITRKKGKLRLYYPMKNVNGAVRQVSEREKMIFKALAYANIDNEDIEMVKAESPVQRLAGKLRNIFRSKE